ncbi:MAG: transporter ATP-binding protein [Rhodospirillales bacterium]|nr:transporter ATP-binding protein [Rhodospirillales bacterium]
MTDITLVLGARGAAPQASTYLRRALTFAQPFRGVIAFILALTLVASTINALEPLLLKGIFDELTGPASAESLAGGIAILALMAIGREATTACSNWLSWRTRLALHETLLQATVGKLQAMPLKEQRSEGVGALVSRLDRSIQGVLGAVTQILFQALPTALFLILSIVVMFQLEWRLALVALVFAPLPAVIALLAAPEQIRRERTLFDHWSRIFSRFTEVMGGMLTVRSFAMEDAERQRFLAAFGVANRVVIDGVRKDARWTALSDFTVVAAKIAAIGVGGWLALHHKVTIGTVIAFIGYVAGMFGPVQGLTGLWSSLQKARVSLEELFRILDLEEQVKDRPDAIELPHVAGAVTFRDVRFGYGDDAPILDGIDLTVRPGEKVAIVGPSGSGKTTLMGLLMRFYDPWSGAIEIDGHDLRSLKQKSLRQRIGVVLQEPLLFNDTVANNIAYGRPGATREEIEAAALAANADGFVRRLPQGYDTMLGERGGLLSGGERQRISIARALLKDPSLVVLDEATSALDAESEQLVGRALDGLLKGRTTFLIAHRLATVIGADKILVLKAGRIVECGRHHELLAAGGYYASLVARQDLGIIRNDEVLATAR